MSRVCIFSEDRQLYELTALLLEQRGHAVVAKPGAYPMIWDADTVPLPRRVAGQTIIAVCREPERLTEAVRVRCIDVLDRPFTFERLWNVLDAALSNAGREVLPPERRSRRPAVTIDEARRCLSCGRRSVTLTPSEMRLFLLLTERRGQVVGREELENVLGSGESLTVHMCSLRKKLGLLSRVPMLETVRGAGYRL